MNYEEKLKTRVETRSIGDRIDEILVYKDHELLVHVEEMDKGVLHVIFYVGGDHHFSLNSNSEIKIIKQS